MQELHLVEGGQARGDVAILCPLRKVSEGVIHRGEGLEVFGLLVSERVVVFVHLVLLEPDAKCVQDAFVYRGPELIGIRLVRQ